MIYQVTFFNFLMGEFFFSLINNEEIVLHNLTIESYAHTLIALLLSLGMTFLGYTLIKVKKNENYILKIGDKKKLSDIYLASLIMYVISFLSRMAILIEKGRFVSELGYSEYYLSYSSNLPFIISFFSSFYYISFYTILSTFPNKRKTRVLFLMGSIVAVVSLGFGQRNGFVLDIILMFIYLAFREQTGQKWIDRKKIAIGLILIPLVIGGMQDLSNKRFEKNISSKEATFKKVESFFISQGGSIHTITYGYQLKDYIPKQDIKYILGPLRDYLTQNIISQKLFGFENWQHDPIKKATKAALYGSTLAYMLFPEGYLAGKGMGSSYIAEIYHDFGYLGIIFGSLLIGMSLKKFDNYSVNSWFKFVFLMLIIRRVIYLPRDSALGWISIVFSIPNILGLLSIILLSKFISKFKKNI
ncbi:sugar isomerase [Propionigenium maris DSM 9537]|uniref:Sugar isomerase n=2 Tax=Propionigenium TaxID=2332 RepID=A0A9W6GM27_9FUSO|nr:sugar isomerase [Propionigenium maris DSM 9537]